MLFAGFTALLTAAALPTLWRSSSNLITAAHGPTFLRNMEHWVLFQTSWAGITDVLHRLQIPESQLCQGNKSRSCQQCCHLWWGQHTSHLLIVRQLWWPYYIQWSESRCTPLCHHISFFRHAQVYLWQAALTISGYSCLEGSSRVGKGSGRQILEGRRESINYYFQSTIAHSHSAMCLERKQPSLGWYSVAGYFDVVQTPPLQTFLTKNRLCFCKCKASEVMH